MEQANEAPVNEVDQEFGQRDAKAPAELARFAILRKRGQQSSGDGLRVLVRAVRGTFPAVPPRHPLQA